MQTHTIALLGDWLIATAQPPASSGPDHRSGPTRGRRREGQGKRISPAVQPIQTGARTSPGMVKRMEDQPTGPDPETDHLNGHQRRRAASAWRCAPCLAAL